MGPEALAQVLRPLQSTFIQADYPNLIVGLEISDDAAVYKLNTDQALIFTTDFFPPVVDDPYLFGAVAAANSMSDVYAMGGDVLLALNIAAFPDDLDPGILSDIFAGGAAKMKEAGGVIGGGHTVVDREPKYGLAVTGTVHPDRILTKAGARPGDVLILTKPLGSGILTTAGKQQVCTAGHLKEAIDVMLQLNKGAARAIQMVGIGPAGVHAGTDITGYGLLGHGLEMAEKSGVALRLKLSTIPTLSSSHHYVEAGCVPGGTGRNIHYIKPYLHTAFDLPRVWLQILCDPQTSGGLLIAVAPGQASVLTDSIVAAGGQAWRIGEVVPGSGLEILE